MDCKINNGSCSGKKDTYPDLVEKIFKSFEFNYWNLPIQKTGNRKEDEKKLEEIKDFWINNISTKITLSALKKGVEAIENGHFHFNSKVPVLKEIIDFLRNYENKTYSSDKIVKNGYKEINKQFLKDLFEINKEIEFLKKQTKNKWEKEEFVQFKNKMIYDLTHSKKYKSLFDKVGHAIKINSKGEYVHDQSIYFTRK